MILQCFCMRKILGIKTKILFAFRGMVSKLSVECGLRRNHTNLKLSKVLTYTLYES
jgi:hypothetical protein